MSGITPKQFATKNIFDRLQDEEDGWTSIAEEDQRVIQTQKEFVSRVQNAFTTNVDELVRLQENSFSFLADKHSSQGFWKKNCEAILELGKRIVAQKKGKDKERVLNNVQRFATSYYEHFYGKKAYRVMVELEEKERQQDMELDDEIAAIEAELKLEKQDDGAASSRASQDDKIEEELKVLEKEIEQNDEDSDEGYVTFEEGIREIELENAKTQEELAKELSEMCDRINTVSEKLAGIKEPTVTEENDLCELVEQYNKKVDDEFSKNPDRELSARAVNGLLAELYRS
jgi:hypothetical protein